jgi:hypothetical protein
MARIVRSLPLATFAIVLHASVAHAERTETPQQLYKSGDSVSLPTIGATITLPAAPAGWAVSMGMESNSNYDILRRQDPTNPALQLDFNRPKSPDCASIAKGFDKLIAAGLKLKKYDPTPFAPASFERWGYELSFYQDKSVLKLCTNTASGPVLAEINFQGPLTSLDTTWAVPLLDEVGRAVNGSRSTGSAAPETTTSGQTVTLPLSGLPAVIPPGFTFRIYGSGGKQEDLIERQGGTYLSIMVNKKPGVCSLNANAAGAHFVYGPPYLPTGFDNKVVEVTTASGTSIAVMCLQKSGYFVLASVGHGGSLTHPDVMVTRTILGPMGEESVGGGGGGGGLGSSGGGGKLGSDLGGSDDDKPASNKKAQAAVTFELGYVYTSADDVPYFEKSTGVNIGLDAFSRSAEGPIGAAAELGGNVGIGKEGFLPWDVHFGVGPALIVPPITLAPLVGIGGDGIGGSTPVDGATTLHLRVDGGAYYYYGARTVIHLGSSFGVGGYFTMHRRGPDDFSKEQRFGLSLLISKYSLGIRSTQYKNDLDVKAGLTTFYFGFVF